MNQNPLFCRQIDFLSSLKQRYDNETIYLDFVNPHSIISVLKRVTHYFRGKKSKTDYSTYTLGLRVEYLTLIRWGILYLYNRKC